MTLTLAEFCAGTGGFSIAFEEVGDVTTVYSNDIEPNSKIIYDLNFDTELTCQDIHTIELDSIPSTDIITAGFPCQAFSIAGERKGFDDDRSNVFLRLIEIIKVKQPRIVLFENVKNLLSHDKGKTMIRITEMIESIGYTYEHKLMNTCEYTGIPQNRERIFIVCFRDNIDHSNFSFPDTKIPFQSIQSILESAIDDKYYYGPRYKIWDRIKDEITTPYTIYQYRRGIVRENKSDVCPTLTANMGCGGHNVPLLLDDKGIRKLTPRECFTLQGFDKTYKLPEIADSKLYKLAGNAITVPLVQLIAKSILEIIMDKK
jgi:DNA (cytosine-5)-methyltransferase 1